MFDFRKKFTFDFTLNECMLYLSVKRFTLHSYYIVIQPLYNKSSLAMRLLLVAWLPVSQSVSQLVANETIKHKIHRPRDHHNGNQPVGRGRVSVSSRTFQNSTHGRHRL